MTEPEHPVPPVEAARQSWPEFGLDTADFDRFLTERGVIAARLSPAVAADLYLAFACSANHQGAHAAFCAAYGPLVSVVCRTFDTDQAFADDVMQKLCELLLVAAPGQRPRIAQYSGKGPLAGWVRTAARRIALRASRSASVLLSGSEDALAVELAAMYDFDVALVKATHQAFFSQAIASAVRAHPDRRMIQLTFLAGVSMTQVGKMYNVNQSTVSRRIKSATNAIFKQVIDETQQHFGLNESEANSFLGLFMSQLDLHLSILETEHAHEPGI